MTGVVDDAGVVGMWCPVLGIGIGWFRFGLFAADFSRGNSCAILWLGCLQQD
jgi:hypothetical protein